MAAGDVVMCPRSKSTHQLGAGPPRILHNPAVTEI